MSTRTPVACFVLIALVVPALPAQPPRAPVDPSGTPLPAPVEPKTPSLLAPIKAKLSDKKPAKDLIPAAAKPTPLYLGDDPSRVPELSLEQAPDKKLTTKEWTERLARSLAHADHLNGRERDGFVKALVKERRDMLGLPFVMGDDCRLSKGRSLAFKDLADSVRTDSQAMAPKELAMEMQNVAHKVERQAEKKDVGFELIRHVRPAQFAAARQILWEADDTRPALVQYFASVQTADATRELARLAVFAPDRASRGAAVKALAVRRERDYTDVLLAALRYPLPAVAGRAADAIAKLERKDLLPQLVDMLDEADPRSPAVEAIDGKQQSVTREVVRVNHHKNCTLCHAPVDIEAVNVDETFVAPVPLPTEKMPPARAYYRQKDTTGLLVRIDVTYLRQDFSLTLAVKDPVPWPEMQRFDFLVRKRALSDDEAKALREKLTPKEEGELTPYQRAAVKALREATGRDLEAKSAAWRKLLKLPAPVKEAKAPPSAPKLTPEEVQKHVTKACGKLATSVKVEVGKDGRPVAYINAVANSDNDIIKALMAVPEIASSNIRVQIHVP